MKRVRFPIVVKRGSSEVKIYRDRKPEGTYYRVVYYLGSKRHRLNFSNFEEAKTEAEAKASQLSRGNMDAVQVSKKDRDELGSAREVIRELLREESGFDSLIMPDGREKRFDLPLVTVAREYADARKLLNGVPLIEAARFYARHHGNGLKRKNVALAVDEMIERKRTKGVSELYLADLRYRLGVFSQAFHCDLNAITPDDVAAFFDGLKLSPRSHNNFLYALRTFFRFAQKHDWLSKEVDPLSRVEKRNGKPTPVEIFTPSELSELLKHASPQVATCIALAAFAGLRAEEILHLDWADIERHPGFIEIAAHKAKTATRRIVPVLDNLARWLAIAPRKENARVWLHSKAWFFESLRDAAKDGKIKWKQNALRHSFISYRLAEIQDVNRVALEAGNSPQMIFRCYRELVTPEQANTWFTIAPEAKPNVVPIVVARRKQ